LGIDDFIRIDPGLARGSAQVNQHPITEYNPQSPIINPQSIYNPHSTNLQ